MSKRMQEKTVSVRQEHKVIMQKKDIIFYGEVSIYMFLLLKSKIDL